MGGAAVVAGAIAVFLWARGGDGGGGEERAAAKAQGDGAAGPARLSSRSEDAPPPGSQPVAEDDDPVGTLLLEGQVLGPDDAPVGGAAISLSSVPPRTATSEADGSFSFDRLVGRTYVLNASAGDLVSGPVSYTLREKSAEPVVIRLAEGARIEVTVARAGGGEPIAGATVELSESSAGAATTDGQGRATLRGVPRGSFALVAARADGHAPGQALIMVPGAPGAVAQARIELRAGAPVSGVVVDESGAPVEGARVAPQDVAQPFGLPDPGDQVKTDERGRFEVPAVAAGTYRFDARHRTHGPGSSDPVTLDGTTKKSDVRIVLPAGAVVAGRVIDGGGAAVPWATVRVGPRAASPSSGGGEIRQVVAGENGAFEMKGLPRTAMLALARSDEASSETAELDLSARAEVRDLVLRLEVSGRIEGVVVDGAGEPVPEARVTAFPDFLGGSTREDLGLRGASSEGTDGGGRFAFRGLPDGAYRLFVSRGAATQSPWSRKSTLAKTGDTGVRLVLEADGGVRGVVQLDDGEAPELFTVAIGNASPLPVSHPRGEFELPGVPPGTHDLTVRGPEFAETSVRDVQVASGQVRDVGTVTVKRGRTVRGRVLTAGGAPVAGATVVIGMQLLGDGTSLASSAMAAFDEQLGVRRARTEANGAYVIRGIAEGKELFLAAEHGEHGRSATATVAPGPDSPTIDLRLAGVGGVAGTVRAAGKPASAIQVFATPRGAASHNTLVQTGQDGRYQIERLAAGQYKVTAMLGAGPGATMTARDVTVVAGKRATLDIDIQVGTITLSVAVAPEGEGTIDAAQVFLFDGKVTVENGKELQEAMLTASDEGGSAKITFAKPGSPARFDKLAPGAKSVCVIPISGDLMDPTVQKRIQENVDSLKVHCRPVTVAPSPEQQSFTATVPPMEPLPAP